MEEMARRRGEGEKGRWGDGIGKVKLRLPQDCLRLAGAVQPNHQHEAFP